ncbi:sugar ABC transporter ATP-binding protein [Nocardioides immobilis]|uniref:Sugar ABC transporter ATP-binding protein n=1 Tax=Nocardioides immobilis TaxID=2049295 RepID=A0A417Y8Y5_9ACTN|nr:sugar ABC transporter ATP-binding protein [Nocardioides immobilis]RHW29045.1 sugar ABC transporter ATP-binding protein [Nocardioides immobilis]
MQNVSKGFAGVQALRDASLEVRAGEIMALMGENGAGKSTLLKILSGAHKQDNGTMLVAGNVQEFSSPDDAHAAGIRVIYQEPEVIPHVSVAENIYVGALPARGGLFSQRRVVECARAELARYGFDNAIDAETLGRDLSPAQRQLVEIMRALIGEVRIIAFDEPTSSLSDVEAERLFELIGTLRGAGVGIIYVSHRMPEVFRIADRVTVLRDGAVVQTREVSETTQEQLVGLMVGRDLSGIFHRQAHEPGDVVLAVEGLTTDDVEDCSFEVRGGEVIGLAGLVGAGRSELAHALIGDIPRQAGRILVDGTERRIANPGDAVKAGIGLVPEERKAQALLMHRSVRDNICLTVLRKLSVMRVVRQGSERALAQSFVRRLNIRTSSIENPVANLSGGNQQKVVLARWLSPKPRVLILDEPTRGVDVGAKAEIYDVVNELARDGMAIIVISSELPEILALSDRVLVMRAGRIVAEVPGREATEQSLVALAMDHEPVTTKELT